MKYPRPLVLSVLTLMAFASSSAQTPAPAAAAPAKQGSKVWKWEDFKVQTKANGERRDVMDGPTATFAGLECHISTLKPGEKSHPPHQHAREEFIIIKEGTLDVSLNGKVTRAGPGSVLFFASNDFHNVVNVGTGPATYHVFNISTAATKSAPAQGATAAAVPGKLVSSVFDWEKMEVKATATGERRSIVDSPTNTLKSFEGHVTTLKPGAAPHAPHHHPDEEIVVIREGTLEITINGAVTRAGPGSIIFCASNDEHGWRNVGTTTATYHVFRTLTEATPAAEKKG